jgi:predicted ATPase with chaperone activity
MLARLLTILPVMILAAALETTRIPRVAGRTGARTACVTTRPFRASHHTISEVGLISGGYVPMPGDVSLAHHERPTTRVNLEDRRPHRLRCTHGRGHRH